MGDVEPETGPSPPWLGIGLMSASALAYELLLIRLFAQVHWASLVGLIISLALLGYGVSGTLLSLWGERWRRHYERFFVINALLFGVGSVVFFRLACGLPLNPMASAWDVSQLGYFTALYVLLAMPFVAVANTVGLSFWRFPALINRVYAADLCGAALGVAAVVGLLFFLAPSEALRLVAAGGVLAALFAGARLRRAEQRVLLAGCMLLLPTLMLVPSDWFRAPRAEYKALSQALAVKGAVAREPLVNPLGVVTVVDSPRVPFRHAPGLSLVSPQAPPGRPALFLDGERLGALYAAGERTDYLDYLLSAAAYQLLESPLVLQAGAGDGTAVAQAVAAGARGIDVVEPNPSLAGLLAAGLSGEPVTIHPQAWRHFLRVEEGQYDLVQLSVGEAIGDVAGLHAQQENYRYTVEGFTDAMNRLSPGGILSVTRGIQLPPRGSLKLVATAMAALARTGASQPAAHLAMLRSWNAVSLLVSREPLPPQALRALRDFARQRMFDLVYLPDMTAAEANRFHRLDRPYLHESVERLLADSAARFIAEYPFIIAPATDDRPYFDRFTRPGRLIEMLAQPGRTGLAQVDWGYSMSLLAAALALVSSLLLIVAPLGRRPRAPASDCGARRRVVVYFGAIGLAFLFVEIAFIQRFQLFLGAPIYAAAIVLGGFLLAAGGGSYLSHRMMQRFGVAVAVSISVGVILAVASSYLWLLPVLFDVSTGLADPARAVLCLALIAPLAMAMGMPFPLGLSHFGGGTAQLIPWAWGINGCASVVSALLAPLLAMEIGFSGLILAALVLYLLALSALPRGLWFRYSSARWAG